MNLVRDIVRVRVEGLELVDELALRRLERLARRHVEVARHLVHLEEAEEVAALLDARETRRVEHDGLMLAERVRAADMHARLLTLSAEELRAELEAMTQQAVSAEEELAEQKKFIDKMGHLLEHYAEVLTV